MVIYKPCSQMKVQSKSLVCLMHLLLRIVHALPGTQQSYHHHPVFTARSPTLTDTCTSGRNSLHRYVEVIRHYIGHFYGRGEVEYCTQKLIVGELSPYIYGISKTDLRMNICSACLANGSSGVKNSFF